MPYDDVDLDEDENDDYGDLFDKEDEDSSYESQSDILLDIVPQILFDVGVGLVPVIGQGADIYDTYKAAQLLKEAYEKGDEDLKLEGIFDMTLCIIGFLPAAGDGIKHTFRAVNRNPEALAPLLLALLRQVMSAAGIKTSPEALLKEYINPNLLAETLERASKKIQSTWVYKKLPEIVKTAIVAGLEIAKKSLPIGIQAIQIKLMRWKIRGFNNSASKNKVNNDKNTNKNNKKPGNNDTAGQNEAYSSGGTGMRSIRAIATEVLKELIANGVMGEHIVDYYCAEELGWGKEWEGHDLGDEGTWKIQPSATAFGKLNDEGILTKLSAIPHGTGLDGVWRATEANNLGKKYAIVEAKSTARPNKSLAPSLSETFYPTRQTLISKGSTKNNWKKKVTGITFQMSLKWIEDTQRLNDKKLSGGVKASQIKKNYSRHVMLLNSLSTTLIEHGNFLINEKNKEEVLDHSDHTVLKHHDEPAVKSVILKKLNYLKKRPGKLDGKSIKEDLDDQIAAET